MNSPAPGGRQRRIRLLPPQFVDSPPEQSKLLAAALRTLFRDHLEERLAEAPQTSVDDQLMREEPV
jgi:hypothetical protein